jgi:threonine dehydratase
MDRSDSMTSDLSLGAIFAARARIKEIVRQTPLVRSDSLSARTGRNVYLKLENLQETGAFKLRGAANCLLSLPLEQRARGVVTVSTGNHGRAVATVGRHLGVRVVVCVPELVLPHKVAAMRAAGAKVVVEGATQDDAEAHAVALAERTGMALISPFDDPAIIAGQGTIGLEILEEAPQITTLISPLSGGGLLGGIALALKSANDAIQTVGVSMARSPVMIASVEAGKPVQLPEEPTLADSLMGGIGLENRYSFELIRRVVDRYTTLTEAEIGRAMIYALRHERLVVEGGGAVGIGALLTDNAPLKGNEIVVIVSGGNVDVEKLLAMAGDPALIS